MDPAAFAELTGSVPLPSPAAPTNGAAYCVNSALYASDPPRMMQPAPAAAEADVAMARLRLQAEEDAIRLVHVLVTCAAAIQAGDYPSAHGNLTEAQGILGTISTSTGIGRVANHFAAALSQRLFPAHPQASPATPPASATPAELHHRFYEAGPYLKFAYSTANLAILDAFEGCDYVHVIDLGLMHGLQWPELIYALAQRDSGPPHLFITGIGPPQTGTRDELREVGIRLAELARSLGVPFSFRGVSTNQLEWLRPWMFDIVPGEAVAINSVLQLHRLLVDPDDADPASPAPIDALLNCLTSVQPKVFTVVEQDADHNRSSLLERFTNALFHYAAMFDSMEDADGALWDAYLRAEIFDIVCGEGSARVERHEPASRWRRRLTLAGLRQLKFRPPAVHKASDILLNSGSSAGYGVLERDGGLAIGWQNRPLYSVTGWKATEQDDDAGAACAAAENCYTGKGSGGGTCGSELAPAAQLGVAAYGTVVPY